jgi:hypothetical protein
LEGRLTAPAARYLQMTKVPFLERPSLEFGEYEVDSPSEWELVLSHLIARQLGGHERLAHHIMTSAETVGSNSVYRKAAETEERVSQLIERLLVNSTQFLPSSVY